MPPKNMSPPAPLCTILHTYQLTSPEKIQKVEQDTLGRLQYMASRLRAILTALAVRKEYNHEWWVENIEYEMMISSALLGQAAIAGAYVPVPLLVWSIGRSMMVGDGAKKIHISEDMVDLLNAEVDPADPTQLFDKYLFDWWSGPQAPGLVSGANIEEAYDLHIKKYGDQIAAAKNEPNAPPLPAFASGHMCSSPTCRAVLESLLQGTTNLLRQLQDLTQKHEKTKLQSKLHLDAMNTLEDAYLEFQCPLADEDIRDIVERASCPYEIPSNHGGGSGASGVDDSDYTDLSSTGL